MPITTAQSTIKAKATIILKGVSIGVPAISLEISHRLGGDPACPAFAAGEAGKLGLRNLPRTVTQGSLIVYPIAIP